jgi:hypothetical protein
MKIVICRSDEAGNFAHEDGQQQQQPHHDSAPGGDASYSGGEQAETQHEQKEHVNAKVYAKPASQRK